MADSIGAQYQTNNQAIINNGENIFFNTPLVTDPGITYNTSNAEFTLVDTGVYIISWWVSAQASSSKYTSFSIISNNSTPCNTPNTKDQLSGSTILNVDTPNQTFSLRNTSGEAVKLGVETPIKANISIFRGASSELNNILDGNSQGSLYGIGSPIILYTMGQNAVAFGNISRASGNNSFACGNSTRATGSNSVAFGNSTSASDLASFACGFSTTSSGNSSFAQGRSTTASGLSSHAQGTSTTADASNSSAAGLGSSTDGVEGAFVVGRYGGPSNATNGNATTKEYGFFIANGSASSSRSLSAMILNNGQGYATSWNTGGADYGEMFETSDGIEIEPGYFVTFDNNDKIKVANSSDKLILGITSKTAGIIGNNNAFNYEDKYLKDEWGAYILDSYSNRIINPKYDDSKEFIGREERCEWVVVGLLGQILVRDDGSSIVGGYCNVGDGGIATKSEYGYRVLKRISNNQILIMFNSLNSHEYINELNNEISKLKKDNNEMKKSIEYLLDIASNKLN